MELHMYTKARHIALAMIVVLLSACSSDDPSTDEPKLEQPRTLIWRSCPDNPELGCATLKVPMDHTNVQSDEIDIALNRLAAIEQPAIGALLFNPGGPGGSGIEALEVLASIDTVPASVRQRYDLIGFDPRGIGASTPVDCEEFATGDVSDYIRDRSEIEDFVQQATNVARQCEEKYGSYLQYLGSMNVVRDMEFIRKALAVEQLDFIGYSYGTRLAALYLQSYPESSGAFVLDGSVRPVASVAPLVEGALPALQSNLEAMLAPIATNTAPASLVIGGTSDAQTPLLWSTEMAAAIGGYFLASSHAGHTSVFTEQSECVDRLVTDFLLDGQLPNGVDCL